MEAEPDYASAWATLAYTALDEYRFGFNAQPGSLDRALSAFRRAIQVDPKEQLARHGLAEAYFASGDVDLFLAEAERAIALNPNNSPTLASMGNSMIFSGGYDRGMALMRKAVALNLHHPSWFYFGITVYHYRKGDYESALEAAMNIEWQEHHWTQMYRATAYGQLGRGEEARAAAAKLLELYPDYAEKAWGEFQRWNHPDEAIEHYAEGLAKAGLDIRTTPPEGSE